MKSSDCVWNVVKNIIPTAHETFCLNLKNLRESFFSPSECSVCVSVCMSDMCVQGKACMYMCISVCVCMFREKTTSRCFCSNSKQPSVSQLPGAVISVGQTRTWMGNWRGNAGTLDSYRGFEKLKRVPGDLRGLTCANLRKWAGKAWERRRMTLCK